MYNCVLRNQCITNNGSEREFQPISIMQKYMGGNSPGGNFPGGNFPGIVFTVDEGDEQDNEEKEIH